MKRKKKRRGDICRRPSPSLLERSNVEDGNASHELFPGKLSGLQHLTELDLPRSLERLQRQRRARRAINANGWEVAMNKSAASFQPSKPETLPYGEEQMAGGVMHVWFVTGVM